MSASVLCHVGGEAHPRMIQFSSMLMMRRKVYGMEVACVQLFFSFTYNDHTYPCAYIDWYTCEGEGPNADMGLWIVSKDIGCSAIIHLDCIIHCAHLIPVYRRPFLPSGLTSSNSLDAFSS